MTSYSEYDRGYENGVQDTLDENPSLKWTTEPPKEAGYYWVDDDIGADILYVGNQRTGEWCAYGFPQAHKKTGLPLTRFTRWAGPIRPPPGDEK